MLLGDALDQAVRLADSALPGSEAPTVSGSGQALIFIPIVVMAALAVWLILVFYADSHPRWDIHRFPPELTGAAPGSTTATREAPRVTVARDGANAMDRARETVP